jgi:hypothetical protein
MINFLQYIDQQQFLVLNSNSLKYDLRSTMERVLHFLDLPMDLAWLPNREEEDSILSEVVQSKFSG